MPVLSSSLLSSSGSFFSTLASLPQATAAAASAHPAPPTSSAAALRAMLARPASIDVTGGSGSSFTPMMLHHLQQSGGGSSGGSGGSGTHSRARAGGSGGAPVRAVDLRASSAEHSPPSIPEHADKFSVMHRHPSSRPWSNSQQVRSAAATPPAATLAARTPALSLTSSPESPTRIPRRSAHSVERSRRPSPAPGATASSSLSASAAALSLHETEAALAASSLVLAVMALSAATAIAAPSTLHVESHAAPASSTSLRSPSPVKHVAASSAALPPRASTTASNSHVSALGSNGTAVPVSAAATPVTTVANSPALAFALEQAKAAKARLLEHKARARADAARVAALGHLARVEKELSSNRERDALMRRRSEVYALNHIKRLYHETMFEQFMADQQRKKQAAMDGSNHTPRAGHTATFDSEVASI